MRTFPTAFLVLLITIFAGTNIQAGGGGGGGASFSGSDIIELDLTILPESISQTNEVTSFETGLYNIIVTNKTSDKVIFEVQDLKTEKTLRSVKINPDNYKKVVINLTNNGIRYRKSDGIWYVINAQ